MSWIDSTKETTVSFFFSIKSRSPASMTRDFNFSWHSTSTCECFSWRSWKASTSFVPFSTDSSSLILLLVCFQLLLTCYLVMQVLLPRHEVSGAMDNNFCQFVVKRPGVGVEVISSRGDRWSAGLLDHCFRGRCRGGEAGPLLSPRISGRIPVGYPCLSLSISRDQSEAKFRISWVRTRVGRRWVGMLIK